MLQIPAVKILKDPVPRILIPRRSAYLQMNRLLL